MEKRRYLNTKGKYLILMILLVLVVYAVSVYPFIKDRKKLEKFAIAEFNYRFKGKYRDSFSGPYVRFEDVNGVQFSWFLKEGCDTTFVYIYVPRQIFAEPVNSGFDKPCGKE